ncbi:hypothetical protein VTO42DRAFT_4086 [Malbranchea cinnamomea]
MAMGKPTSSKLGHRLDQAFEGPQRPATAGRQLGQWRGTNRRVKAPQHRSEQGYHKRGEGRRRVQPL